MVTPFQDLEVVILRQYEDAHKADDHTQMTRLSTALEVLREAASIIQQWPEYEHWRTTQARTTPPCTGSDKPPTHSRGARGNCSGCGSNRSLRGDGMIPIHRPTTDP